MLGVNFNSHLKIIIMRNIYLLSIGLLLGVIISCTEVNLEMEYPEISSKGEKIQVCHFDEMTNSWNTLHI